MTERYGLRKSLLWGYASAVACSLLAHAACTAPLPPDSAFALLYFSQVLGAVGQPLFLNNVVTSRCLFSWLFFGADANARRPQTLFAGTWFPAAERDAAVALSLLCVAAGTVFISILAPAVVTTPAQVDRVFAFQVPLWAAIFLADLMFSAEEPAAPPSASAAVLRAERRRAAGTSHDDGGMASLRHAVGQARELCGSSSFMMLNFSSSILTGLVYLLATVVGQLFSPCGDSDTEAGAALAALAALSCVGVLVYLVLLQRAEQSREKHAVETAPHDYRAHQIAWSGAACVGVAVVLLTERLHVSPAMLVAAWGALGLFSGTLLNGASRLLAAKRELASYPDPPRSRPSSPGALTMEHAAELSFPVPPNVSVALLAITSSVISFAQVLVGTALLASSRSSDCSSVFTPFAASCVASAAGGVALLAMLTPHSKRAEAEARVQAAADAKAARLRDAAGKGAYGAMA